MKVALHGGFGVIVLILSLLTIAVVVFVAISLYTGRGSVGSESIGTPIDRAKSIECEAQIRKVKMQLQIYRFENDKYPARLNLVEGLSNPDLQCPVTGSSFEYDAASGRVSCPDHKS
jgi:hypothetical protein